MISDRFLDIFGRDAYRLRMCAGCLQIVFIKHLADLFCGIIKKARKFNEFIAHCGNLAKSFIHIDRCAVPDAVKLKSVIHLKDGIGRAGKALGEGNAPVLDVIAKAKELNLAMVVESEGLDPTGLEEVARCIEFLKKNG